MVGISFKALMVQRTEEVKAVGELTKRSAFGERLAVDVDREICATIWASLRNDLRIDASILGSGHLSYVLRAGSVVYCRSESGKLVL